MLALLDALGLDRVLLVAHDWGAYVGYRMILREPERFDGYLAMNMAHPWQKPASVLPSLWKLYYQIPLATVGVPLMTRTSIVESDSSASGPTWIPRSGGCSATASATRCVPARAATRIEPS